MSEERKKAVWPWIVALLVVLLGYPLSFGPACWWFTRHPRHESLVNRMYHPVLRVWDTGPSPVRQVLNWYANLGAAFEICVRENNDRHLEVIQTGESN